jgi:tripartite ATP-independent transporter DctM subunit
MVNLGLLVILGFLALTLIGFRVYIAIGLPAVMYYLMQGNVYGAAQGISRTVDTFSLVAVPLFIFVGALINHGGIADKLFKFASELLGPTEGGLAYVNIFASLIFSGMSGSALADIGGIGRVIMDEMKESGYENDYTAALTSSAATIGPLFPPSIPLIVFGVLAGVSVLQLLLAGVVPALLLFAGLGIVTMGLSKRRNFPQPKDSFDFRAIGKWTLVSLPALGAPLVLIFGMLSGIFGVTEIAAVTVGYILFINVVFYRNFNVDYIWTAAVDAARTTATIVILVAVAGMMAQIITLERTHVMIAEALFSISKDPVMLLIMVNVLLLIMGLFMEPLSAMLISIPIVIPTLTQVGVDPIHIGVIMVFNLMIGLVTPPLGLSLFLASDIAGAEYEETMRELAPYYAVLLAVLALVTFVPAVSLYVPNL